MAKETQVELRLVPLGSTRTEGIRSRKILLTDKKPFVEVSRASNNPTKPLSATSTNAMIDSPIMSRLHARFSLSKKPNMVGHIKDDMAAETEEMQGIWLEDTKSTHGTFLGGRRLNAGVPYKLMSGEDVTFGTRVINGLHEHHPKTFRVYFEDVQGTDETPGHAPLTQATTSEDRRTKRASPAPSLEFVKETNLDRNHFTVPSSEDEYDVDYVSDEDDEDDDKSVSDYDVKEQSSPATTPDSKTSKVKRKSSDIEKLLNKDTPDGTSKTNPIELDEVAMADLVNDLDSEDGEDNEPPDVQSSKSMPASKVTEGVSALLDLQATTTATGEGPVPERLDVAVKIIPETQAAKEANQGFEQTNSPASPTGTEDSESDENFEPTDDESEGETPSDSGQSVDQIEDQDEDQNEDEDVEMDMDRTSGTRKAIEAIDGMQARAADKSLQPPKLLLRRSPSPSDAALAKRAFESGKRNTLPAWDTYVSPLSPLEHDPQDLQGDTQWAQSLDNQYPRSFYDDMTTGYINPACYGMEIPRPWAPCASRAVDPLPMITHDDAPPHDEAWEVPTSVASNYGSVQTSAYATSPPDKIEENASGGRLDISNLINKTQGGEHARGEKRKAEKISLDDGEDWETAAAALQAVQDRAANMPMPSPLGSRPPFSADEASHWTNRLIDSFDEAQRQDDESGMAAARQAKADAQAVTERSTTPLSPPPAAMDRSTSSGPSSARIRKHHHKAEVQAQRSEFLRPAKRARTSSSSSSRFGGIAKFAAGMAAGAIGVVAAIVLSTPESVREEAWREMNGL